MSENLEQIFRDDAERLYKCLLDVYEGNSFWHVIKAALDQHESLIRIIENKRLAELKEKEKRLELAQRIPLWGTDGD